MSTGNSGRGDRSTLRRFMRFGIVGGSGVAVDMGILFMLADPGTLGWGLTVSKLFAAESAIINNFVWNDIWTFRDLASKQPGLPARIGRFIKFNSICLAGIGINVALLDLQVYGLRWNVYIANFIAIALVSVWNFWMNMKFGWAQPKRG